MSCEIEEIVFAGEKTTAFFCSPHDDPPQPCGFCQTPDAPWLCDWPTIERVEVPVEHLKIGDIWITQTAAKRARIVEIEEDGINCPYRRFWIAIPGHKNPYPYNRLRGDRVLTERPGTCDRPCCDLHAREAGENIHYCQDHWAAWELVT